jgi:hypothetical protein
MIEVPKQRDGVADLGQAEFRDALSEGNKTTFHHLGTPSDEEANTKRDKIALRCRC